MSNPEDDSSFTASSSAAQLNPSVGMVHIRDTYNEFYKFLQNNFKFIFRANKRRLQVGGALVRENHFFRLKWVFYDKTKSIGSSITTVVVHLKKVVYARADQRVYPFYPLDDEEEIKIKLRTTKNEGILDELKSIAGRQGVDIIPLGACAGASSSFTSLAGASGDDNSGSTDSSGNGYVETADQQKAREDAEAKAAQERKRQEDEERAACMPLDYDTPPSFDDQNFIEDWNFVRGSIDESDLAQTTGHHSRRDHFKYHRDGGGYQADCPK